MAHCGIAAEKVYSLTGDVTVEVDKWHGVKLAGEAGLEAQWRSELQQQRRRRRRRSPRTERS